MEVSNKHGGRLDIKNAVAASFDLLKGRGIDGEGRLGRAASGSGSLGPAATLAVAVQGNASVFGMDSTIVAEKKIAAHKGAAALHALERPLLGICIAKLAYIAEGGQATRVKEEVNIRERSCLLLCSLLLKARLQNWHLYFLSGASEVFRVAGVDAAEAGMTATLAPGIFADNLSRSQSSGGTRAGCNGGLTTMATMTTTVLGSGVGPSSQNDS
jgi:hypothetical protein